MTKKNKITYIKSNNNRKTAAPDKCSYCGSPVILRSASGIYKENKNDTMLYVCSKYPQCDAYIRTHPGTDIPVGSMANHELRTLRRSAHKAFDRIHYSGIMSKDDAYHWLAALLQSPHSQAHIGHLGEYYCELVISESKKLFEKRKNNVHPLPGIKGGVCYALKQHAAQNC